MALSGCQLNTCSGIKVKQHREGYIKWAQKGEHKHQIVIFTSELYKPLNGRQDLVFQDDFILKKELEI